MTTATRTVFLEAQAARPMRPVRALVALIVASALMQAAVMLSSTAATLLVLAVVALLLRGRTRARAARGGAHHG